MAAIDPAIGFGPQRMTMEERLAIAAAKRHRAHLQLRDAGGTKGLTVKRGVFAGRGQGRHHIGERTEPSASDVQRAAGKSLRRKAAARGFQQGQACFQHERERAPARLYTLDAFEYRRPRLDDAAHRQLVGFGGISSRPRASSSSRTSRFGTLP
jgi:hypothetical protein